MKSIIYNITLAALAIIGVASCTPTVDDVFDKPSSERIENYYNEVDEILKGSKEGWRVEYYASTTYGGYNMFCKFEGDKVTFASEKAGNHHAAGVDDKGNLIRATSHYKMEQSMGAVISFDSYNPILHYYSEPKNADYGIAGDGMAGDFEFRIRSASKDSIVLVGKKHNSVIRMYPISSGTTWEDYYKKVKETEHLMAARTYFLFKNGEDQKVTINTSYRRLVFNYTDEKGIPTSVGAPFIITAEGYKFYVPFKLNDQITINALTKSDDGIYKATNDQNIWIESQILPLVEQLNNSMWFISVANLGAFAQPYWKTFQTALETAGTNHSKATLYWAFIGNNNGKVGFHMNAGGDRATVGLTITTDKDAGDNIVKIRYNIANTNKAGTSFYENYKLKEALKPFIGNSKVSTRTFKLEVDNPRRPTYMILTDQKEPTNIIRLSAEELHYPFGDEPEG